MPRPAQAEEFATVVDLTDTPQQTNQRKRKRREAAQEEQLRQQLQDQEPAAEEAAAAVAPAEEHTKLGEMSCIICMDTYTNVTVALCGHVFCHECLIRALMASEQNNNQRRGACPSCRKPIARNRDKQVIPIKFMKKSHFLKR